MVVVIWLYYRQISAPEPEPLSYPTLRDSRDARLQQALEQALAELELAQAASQGRLAVALADISDPYHPRLAERNGDTMLYAASLPKIAILLGAFERISAGELPLNEKILTQLLHMIRHSSNEAATQVLQRVGTEYLAGLLKAEPYRFYDPRFGGGLWVGKAYAQTAAWRRDPLNNISHGATALQVARFYYYLATGRLVAPCYSQMMKSILADSAIRHKFVLGLAQHRPDAVLYRKSGSWRDSHADSALIEHRGRRYIAVALAQHPEADTWLSRLIVKLDAIILATSAKEQPNIQATASERIESKGSLHLSVHEPSTQ